MEIMYVDNTRFDKYGPDRKLQNNWDPNKYYGNEYVDVHIRIGGNYYRPPEYNYTEEDKLSFYNEVRDIFKKLDWLPESDSPEAMTVKKGKAHLYLHPQDFSGIVLKKDIKRIATELSKGTTFNLRWVDLYDTVYDISDEEYEKYLCSKDEAIKASILKACVTKRVTTFYAVTDVVSSVAYHFRLKRVGVDDGVHHGVGQTTEHIINLIYELVDAGYLICSKTTNGNKCVRTINKTEQKKRKLFV